MSPSTLRVASLPGALAIAATAAQAEPLQLIGEPEGVVDIGA